MSCGIGRRRGSDPVLLWLRHRPAAIAPIGPLAWEPPYTAGMALEKTKKKKKLGIRSSLVVQQAKDPALSLLWLWLLLWHRFDP